MSKRDGLVRHVNRSAEEACMFSDPNGPALVAYSTTCLVLSANLIFLWVYSGAVRARGGVAINPEDAARFGAQHAEHDPPAVARVLRAHANAQATIYPFLLLGLAFVLAGGSYVVAVSLFSIFTIGRIGHSIAYLGGRQPWRTIFFMISGLSLIALMIALIWVLVAGALGH
jgi:prostaglandin-E synthase 1